MMGVPYIPVTPYLVAVPLPVKLEIVFGEPIYLSGSGNEDDEVVAEYVYEVKTQISEMLDRGKKERLGLVLRGRP
jgi:hypothetical protein